MTLLLIFQGAPPQVGGVIDRIRHPKGPEIPRQRFAALFEPPPLCFLVLERSGRVVLVHSGKEFVAKERVGEGGGPRAPTAGFSDLGEQRMPPLPAGPGRFHNNSLAVDGVAQPAPGEDLVEERHQFLAERIAIAVLAGPLLDALELFVNHQDDGVSGTTPRFKRR